MEIFRNTIRWLLLAGGVIVGLFYLNSAAYASWISWGPPNNYPLSWEHASIVRLGFSFAALSIGVVLFIALRKGFKFNNNNYKVYFFIVVLVLSLIYPQAREYFLVDSCLDSGGAWQSDYFQCKN
jgi:hypothetical protein